MTSPDHKTGTVRILEALSGVVADYVLNIQGDEPLLDGDIIDAWAAECHAGADSVTLKQEITEDLEDPNTVKVVSDIEGWAMYFSRSPVPYRRNEVKTYKHIGIYAYRKDVLMRFASLPQSPLEKGESLEQLRLLENGFRMKVVEVKKELISVDIPEDIERVETFLRNKDES
jgi:3-deoxy-manno-octulosonate cytidylyltransferase (CMP-KDO synthetase)